MLGAPFTRRQIPSYDADGFNSVYSFLTSERHLNRKNCASLLGESNQYAYTTDVSQAEQISPVAQLEFSLYWEF